MQGLITAEATKAFTETAVNILHNLFKKNWKEEKSLDEWKECILIKLPKWDDLRDLINYQGSMLLSVPDNVLNKILLKRMKEAVDQCSETSRLDLEATDNALTRY